MVAGSCLLAVFSSVRAAQAQQPVLETPAQTNERIRSSSRTAQQVYRDYVIGPGDLIAVEVFDVAELSRSVRVSQTGTIALPLVPVRLHVAGLTEVQTEQKIAEVLQANGLVSHPEVSVSVKEKKSKPITVIGAVGHPMVYQAERQVTLLEVLSEAGGLSNDAGSVVIVTRPAPGPSEDSVLAEIAAESDRSPASAPQQPGASQPAPAPALHGASPAPGVSAPQPVTGQPPSVQPSSQRVQDPAPKDDPPPTVFTIPLEDLLDTAGIKNNMVLEGGDIVSVPHSGIVYVMGAVQRPGGFVLANDRSQMTTLKVLSLAGGLQRTAKAGAAVILRKDSSGQQRQVPVNLRKVMARQSEDVVLNASDILFVPESGGKQAMIRTAEIALALGTGVALFRLSR